MRQLTMRLLVAVSLGAAVVSCAGSDDADQTAPDSAPATELTESVEPVPSAEVVETTEPSPTTEVPELTAPPVTTDASDQLIVLARETPITAPAVAVCEAIGDLDTEMGLEALMALFTPDAVVTDAMTGTTYSGTDEIAAYYASLGPSFGIEGSTCNGVMQVGEWAAGRYELRGAEAPISRGIAAMHVTNGLVDQQINHYTAVMQEVGTPLDNGTGVLAIGETYCQGWIDRDAEVVSRLTTDAVILHARQEFVGQEQAVAFMEVLPYDIHTCGHIMKVDNWDAMGTIMTDPATGAERAVLHVLELDPVTSGKVAQHWFHFDG